MPMIRGLLIFTALMLFAAVARPASCTFGIDCYADCRQGSGCVAGNYRNANCQTLGIRCGTAANMYVIEDFEDPDYYSPTDTDAWWRAGSGGSDHRGGGAKWVDKWGGPYEFCSIASNEPAASHCVGVDNPYGCCTGAGTGTCPTDGVACGNGLTCWGSEWSAGDPWDGNFTACIDMQTDAEVDDEVPGLTRTGSLYGSHDMALRNGHGSSRSFRDGAGGEVGQKTFSASSQMYYIAVVAYSTNLISAANFHTTTECQYSDSGGDFAAAPWKHNEWGGTYADHGHCTGNGTPFGCCTGAGTGNCPAFITNFLFGGSAGSNQQPYRAMPLGVFAEMDPQGNKTACTTDLQDGLSIGLGSCEPGGFPSYIGLWADVGYNRSEDWPLGTKALIRSQWQGLGTSNCSFDMWWWHEDAVAEEHIISMSGFNCAEHFAVDNYNKFVWNNYYNGGNAQYSSEAMSCQNPNESFYIYYDIFETGTGQAAPSASDVGWPQAISAPPVDTWDIPTCPAAGCFSMILPSTCVQGVCSDPSEINATASGTATGNISWERDDDCNSANGVNYVTIVECANSSTCLTSNGAGSCDMNKTQGTYTINIRSCRGSGTPVCDTATANFQVQAPAAQVPGNRIQGGSIRGGGISGLELYNDPYRPLTVN